MPEQATPSSRSRGNRITFLALGALLTGAVLFYATMYFGRVNGTEFSPHTFKRRSFHYFEIPLVGWQVTPMQRSDDTGDLENYLITTGLVPRQQNQGKPRWDLVRALRSDTIVSQGEAQILCSYLDATDSENNPFWLEWSKENTELSKVLWPAIVKVARHELYILVPELLLAARSVTDADPLQKEIDNTLAAGYLRTGRFYQQLGNHEAAVVLLTESLAHDPDHADALKHRAESQAALGNRANAAADLEAAQATES